MIKQMDDSTFFLWKEQKLRLGHTYNEKDGTIMVAIGIYFVIINDYLQSRSTLYTLNVSLQNINVLMTNKITNE